MSHPERSGLANELCDMVDSFLGDDLTENSKYN
jgi:hypothetical protein